MKKVLFIFLVLICLLGLAGCGRDLSKYYSMKEPAIKEMPDQKVIVAEVKGDPNTTGKSGITAIYRMYFTLYGKNKGMDMSLAPRARWPKGFDTSKQEFIGLWALPVPNSITELPGQHPGLPTVKLDTWTYGTVAEIVHIGSYSDEKPTIEKLYKFIIDSGYEIAGAHEEEYIKGPGMIFKGNPNKYITIIRYVVKKAGKGKK